MVTSGSRRFAWCGGYGRLLGREAQSRLTSRGWVGRGDRPLAQGKLRIVVVKTCLDSKFGSTALICRFGACEYVMADGPKAFLGCD